MPGSGPGSSFKMAMQDYEINIGHELWIVEGKEKANGEQLKRKYDLPDLDSEDQNRIEGAEVVAKRSIEICSLMFGIMFGVFDHSLKE